MADSTTVPTVWILGAGFSKPLGGPLLDDLLSPATTTMVRTLYRENPFIGEEKGKNASKSDVLSGERRAATLARNLYAKLGPEAKPGQRLWSDAEAFVEQLDAAHHAPDSPAARVVDAVKHAARGQESPRFEQLRDAARRLVAAACCAFLKDADKSRERWQPYVSWREQLARTDTVVTFNYDRVLELLGNFQVQLPHIHVDDGDPFRGPDLFKLHGSVDWKREAKNGVVKYLQMNEPEFALGCEGSEIGIATPGPTKRLAADELKYLWATARRRIADCGVLVFVGYRFPPSDAEAREKLLGAIRGNTNDHLQVHVVLGPKRSDDVIRLEELLRYTMEREGRRDVLRETAAPKPYRLMTHALYAQDFLSVWDRELLYPSGHRPYKAVQ